MHFYRESLNDAGKSESPSQTATAHFFKTENIPQLRRITAFGRTTLVISLFNEGEFRDFYSLSENIEHICTHPDPPNR